MHVSVSSTNDAEPTLSHAHSQKAERSGSKKGKLNLTANSFDWFAPYATHINPISSGYICQETQIHDTASSQRPLPDSILKIQDTQEKKKKD